MKVCETDRNALTWRTESRLLSIPLDIDSVRSLKFQRTPRKINLNRGQLELFSAMPDYCQQAGTAILEKLARVAMPKMGMLEQYFPIVLIGEYYIGNIRQIMVVN